MRTPRLLLAILMALAAGGIPIVAAAPAADPDPVQVFFSRDPDSFNDFTAVFAVSRDVPKSYELRRRQCPRRASLHLHVIQFHLSRNGRTRPVAGCHHVVECPRPTLS